MSDNTKLLTRRNALKGIAAFAGTSAVGAGTIIHASEPAVADGHVMSIDDITIETNDGEIEEFGLSDLWFEITYENIPHELLVTFAFSNGTTGYFLPDDLLLGISGDGTETFGYGQAYSDEYDTSLDGLPKFKRSGSFSPPLNITIDSWLEELSLADDEDDKTINTRFDLRLYSSPSEDLPDLTDWELLDDISAEFDVNVQRVEAGGEVSGGEGGAYGED